MLAGQAFSDEWPKPEQWVGKKPSEIIHAPGSGYEPEGLDFYNLLLNTGGRSGAIWSVNLDDLDVGKMEHPIQKIGQYLVFMAYDCGDMVYKKGAALAYNLDGGQTIVCEQTRTREVDPNLESADIEGMNEEDIYLLERLNRRVTDHPNVWNSDGSSKVQPNWP